MRLHREVGDHFLAPSGGGVGKGSLLFLNELSAQLYYVVSFINFQGSIIVGTRLGVASHIDYLLSAKRLVI